MSIESSKLIFTVIMKEIIVAIIIPLYFVSCSRFTIINSSAYTFHISNKTHEENDFGIFSTLRPLTVQSLELIFNHTENIQIEYGNRLKLYLSIDLGQVKLVDIKYDSSISHNYDPHRNILTLRATDPNIDNFSFIISSDPQPYRLANNGDPNAQRLLWLRSTSAVFQQISKKESDAHLMIVNGDLTEFGRTTQWKTFQFAISGIQIPMAYGLGNHDYQNNVEDCSDADPIETPLPDHIDTTTVHNKSCPDKFVEKIVDRVKDMVQGYLLTQTYPERSNLCARRMIERMRSHTSNLTEVMWDFSSDEDSLAYAWNYGSILRFVQLHNRPNYTVELKDFFSNTDIIKPSYHWLIADMSTYKNRSYVLNVHDAIEHTDLEALRPYFQRIKAIFAGHTHEAGVKCFNGVVIFDSGALFKNEFLRVNFSKGGRCLDVLHFVENKYVLPLANDYCFQSVLENPCIS